MINPLWPSPIIDLIACRRADRLSADQSGSALGTIDSVIGANNPSLSLAF